MIRRDGIIAGKKGCRLQIVFNWHQDKKIITFMISLLMIVSSFSMSFVFLTFLAPYAEAAISEPSSTTDDDGEATLCCLPAGTMVTMADGVLKPIEKIREGDKVLSYNVEKGIFVYSRVLNTIIVVREGVYEINGGILSPTDDHPLYVEKPDGRRGWAAVNPEHSKARYGYRNAMPLEIGDKLLTASGTWVKIESIVFRPGPVKTYTFMVGSVFHDYFANGFLVSNAVDCPIPKPPPEPEPECSSNSDCGTNYCTSWSSPYCDGDKVKKKRTCYSYTCSNGQCTSGSTIQYTTVTTCSDTISYSYKCTNGDVYRSTCTIDYYCSDGACVKGSTSYSSYSFYKDCGSTSYGSWSAPYCDGDVVKKKRLVTEKGCSDGNCYSNSYYQYTTVTNCNNDDGYYDNGETRVTTPSLSVSSSTIYVGSTLSGSASGSVRQKKQVHRDYYCSGGSCVYTTGSTRWVTLGDTVTYEYKFYNVNDGVVRQDWSSDNSYIVQQSDAHNTIRVYVRAVSSGDYSSTIYVDKTVANSAPSTPTSLSSSPSTVYVGNTLSATASGSSDPDGDGITYEYRYYNVNDAVYRTDWITGGYPITEADAHKTIRIYVRAKDSYANALSGTKYIDIPVANSAPVIAGIPDKSVNEGSILTFDMGYSDNDGDTVTWSISSGPGSIINGDDYTYSDEWDADHNNEQYTVTIAVNDGHGGSDTETFILSVDDINRNPVINSLTHYSSHSLTPYNTTISATINTTENVTFTSNVSDPENDALTYTWQILNSAGVAVANYSNANNVLEHQFRKAGVYKVRLIVNDVYSGSVQITSEDIIVKQKIVIPPDKDVFFIPWQNDEVNITNLETKFNPGDVIKLFDSQNGRFSKCWIVGVSSLTDAFDVRKGVILRVEPGQLSKETGISDVISTVTSDSAVSIPLNYTYDKSTKSGNPGYNYFTWTSDKIITAHQLGLQLNLSADFRRGQTISKYNSDSGSWQGYIWGIGLENTPLNFNIYPGDIICIKVNPEVAGKKLVIQSTCIQVDEMSLL